MSELFTRPQNLCRNMLQVSVAQNTKVRLSLGYLPPSVSPLHSQTLRVAEDRSDSISYCTMMNAVVRAGHIPFAISTRNGGTSLAHLFSVTETLLVYTSADSAVQNIVADANEKLSQSKGKNIPSFSIPMFGDFQVDLENASLLPPLLPPSMSSIAIILHSSGKIYFVVYLYHIAIDCIPRIDVPPSKTNQSVLRCIQSVYCLLCGFGITSLGLSHKTYFQWSILPCFGERDLCGETMACQSIPIL